jgi:hypothetical protein
VVLYPLSYLTTGIPCGPPLNGSGACLAGDGSRHGPSAAGRCGDLWLTADGYLGPGGWPWARAYLRGRLDFRFDFRPPRVVVRAFGRAFLLLAFFRLVLRRLAGFTRSGSSALPVSRFQSSNVSGEISPLTRSSANFRRCARLLKRIGAPSRSTGPGRSPPH